MNIIDFIGSGKKNAVTIKTLCYLTGLKNRDVRWKISIARREYPIVNLQDGNGYYIANNKKDAKLFLNQEMNRANEILNSLKGVEKFLNN